MYDYGPPGSSLQANIIEQWQKHFIVEENMLELETKRCSDSKHTPPISLDLRLPKMEGERHRLDSHTELELLLLARHR